jgi:hypothetical protein
MEKARQVDLPWTMQPESPMPPIDDAASDVPIRRRSPDQADRPQEIHHAGSHNFKGTDGWIQGFNAQDGGSDHKFILAIGVNNQDSDEVQLLHMNGRMETITSPEPDALMEDADYWSTAGLKSVRTGTSTPTSTSSVSNTANG